MFFDSNQRNSLTYHAANLRIRVVPYFCVVSAGTRWRSVYEKKPRASALRLINCSRGNTFLRHYENSEY